MTVVLYYFDDRSVREIAQATGVTEGTVKSRRFFPLAVICGRR